MLYRPPSLGLIRLGLHHRCHAVLVVPPRGAHEGGSYSDCMGGGGGTTLYLLPGLDVSTAASTPSRWDLSGSTYGRSPQAGVYVEVDVCLHFGIASPQKVDFRE